MTQGDMQPSVMVHIEATQADGRWGVGRWALGRWALGRWTLAGRKNSKIRSRRMTKMNSKRAQLK